ncbi:phosphoserine aminotransferase [Alicyclobacillus hesperidum subsp. aegles]|uniref:3-phosphoserine/phosphohydroxythreonine transaminase n=1 Tax=Alicyclobacillus hesperidum TaxID=89784 RepID=UPI0007191B05|nr:3-phosphoserine/phosphohydroxythreonine transaminase [Alicyclobacillus hesperidum]KRW92470.1 MFS transporter [Alicyclobacillus tengchongensis]GLG01174.1 phosphoserine aminotransferase [Alicyclobacillus hesperidum subsp. aegles]
MKRADNFNAGPAALPLPVLERIQAELPNYSGTGMSVMEFSHRSAEYEAIHNDAQTRLRRLLGIPDGYQVLFLQGGASLQFAMLPMNFLKPGEKALYVLTGSWSQKAADEAGRYGELLIDDWAKQGGYRDIPTSIAGDDPSLRYVHITSNNTIYGTQWRALPKTTAPLVADMSSDILSRPVRVEDFALIYAGAQKNIGPSGVTVVIVRDDFLQTANSDVPTVLKYSTHAQANSLYNTPPTFAIYVMSCVLQWVEETGGLAGIVERNQKKAAAVYDVIDTHPNLYLGHAEKRARSEMNVTFRLPSDELTKSFLAEAAERGFVGVKGYRTVGGVRVSLYNAVPVEAALRFAEFMQDFARRNG